MLSSGLDPAFVYRFIKNRESSVYENVLGLEVDFANKSFTRLCGAVGKSRGADFDSFKMYGGRRRCNLTDDGTVTAYYGDTAYTETGRLEQAVTVGNTTYPIGTPVQVMVEQPKFYYKTKPLIIENQEDSGGTGFHLRKVQYFISDKKLTGFKLHPAFRDENGASVNKIYIGAYEGSVYDVSAGAYIDDDSQVTDFTVSTGDRFSSTAGVKPASGLSQNLTRTNLEVLCKNRGSGWHSLDIRQAAMEELLMMIELGTMNTQSGSGSNGIVNITDNSSYNCASLTGSTSALGNSSGQADVTVSDINGVQTNETANGKTSYSYRGTENPWGNIWKFVHGINILCDGTMHGGVPYICTDYAFAESKNSGNYVSAGFSVANSSGYINALGYSQSCDWLMLPSETENGAGSSLPVGDSFYCSANVNGYRVARLGGSWNYNANAGGFCWYVMYGTGDKVRSIGGRLTYTPHS